MMVKMIQIQLIFADIYIYLQPGREEGGVCTAQSSVYSVHSSRQSVCTVGVQALVSIDQSWDPGVQSELCMT